MNSKHLYTSAAPSPRGYRKTLPSLGANGGVLSRMVESGPSPSTSLDSLPGRGVNSPGLKLRLFSFKIHLATALHGKMYSSNCSQKPAERVSYSPLGSRFLLPKRGPNHKAGAWRFPLLKWLGSSSPFSTPAHKAAITRMIQQNSTMRSMFLVVARKRLGIYTGHVASHSPGGPFENNPPAKFANQR